MQPLILTLQFDAPSFERVNALRRTHFPPERNVLNAHITLFHALPAERETEIRETLDEICARTSSMTLGFKGVRSLGKGVAVEVEAPALEELRRQLGREWNSFLGPQDSQRIRPHVTIQNKVSPDAARMLYEELSTNWKAWEGRGEGLQLWWYRGGPWEAAGQFPFKLARDESTFSPRS